MSGARFALACGALLALSACEKPRAEGLEAADAAPSPNASILPAPLAVAPAGLAASSRADTPSSATAQSLEALRGDREVPSDPLGAKETLGVTMTGEWRFGETPGPPKAAEVHLEGIAAAKRLVALKWQIAATESGRLRIVFDGRAFPIPSGSELRARADRLGHVLVFPGGGEYRPVAPGALRALFGDRRLDVVPLVSGQITPKGMAPARAGRSVRRVELATKMGTLTLELARVPEAGAGAALLCRTLVELIAIDPATPACVADDLPLRAAFAWPGGGSITFEAQDPSKRGELPYGELLVPPSSAQLAQAMPPSGASVFLSRDEAAAFRTRAVDVGPPSALAPAEGLLARNATDGLRYLLVDGVPAAWVLPSAEQLVLGLPRGRYVASWRSFLGDALEPSRTVEVPARVTLGEPADAGAPAPAKSKLRASRPREIAEPRVVGGLVLRVTDLALRLRAVEVARCGLRRAGCRDTGPRAHPRRRATHSGEGTPNPGCVARNGGARRDALHPLLHRAVGLALVAAGVLFRGRLVGRRARRGCARGSARRRLRAAARGGSGDCRRRAARCRRRGRLGDRRGRRGEHLVVSHDVFAARALARDTQPDCRHHGRTDRPRRSHRGSIYVTTTVPAPDKCEAVLRLRPCAPDRPVLRFARSWRRPHGVRWFGVASFWGHLQHFVASAIATGDIDSRDWMRSEDPRALSARIASELGGEGDGETLLEALGRDLWIDFIADTGDDVTVSEAVGRLVSTAYEVPDPEREGEYLVAPRGDVLLHGGDTAYPVATTLEMHDRFVVPFNRALVPRHDGKRRVLLGIPGNHDWYAGLDGFGRMFRRRVGELAREDEQPSVTLDRNGVALAVEWAEKFVAGKSVSQRKALVLDGYVPVQDASYWVLPLSRKIHLFGVDRQLRTVDFRQRTFFTQWRKEHPDATPWVILPDPVIAYLEDNPPGVAMIEALDLDLTSGPHLVLAGDTHHYSRSMRGPTMHVTAGGGGAFLHAARIDRKGLPAPIAEWPGAKQSGALLSLVPWHVASGRAGLIPHLVMLLFFAPALGVGLRLYHSDASVEAASAVAALVGAVVCALIGGWRHGRFLRIATLASLTGAMMGLAPTVSGLALSWIIERAGFRVSPNVHGLVVLVLAVFFGALAFGWYLCALTLSGLESSQALTALGHPSHKHFLRIRVRADGSAIDAWCVGLFDPLAKDEEPVLVDRFTWTP